MQKNLTRYLRVWGNNGLNQQGGSHHDSFSVVIPRRKMGTRMLTVDE